MLQRWALLFVVCALPAFGRQNPRTQSVIGKLKQGRENYFKLGLHKILEETKTRRDIVDGNRPAVSSRLLINESTEVTAGCTIPDSDSVSVSTSGNALFMLHNATLIRVRGFRPSASILNLQAFRYGNRVLLIAQHAGETEGSYVSVYVIETLILKKSQRIQLGSGGLVSSTKLRKELYIAVVTNIFNSHEFRLYRGTQGKDIDEILRTRVQAGYSSLAIWAIGRDVYVAISYASTGMLEIKQLSENSRTMSYIQRLKVSTHIIKPFEDEGSHYLACGTKESIIIYWWTGSAFELLHSVFLRSQITDIAIHRLSSRLLIAVASKHEVEFLVKDSSAKFVIAGRQMFGLSMSLKSVLLWKSGANVYMLPLFEEKPLFSLYEIRLEFKIADAGGKLSLDNCMQVLDNSIYEREGLLNNTSSRAENVWLSSDPYRGSSMEVKGTIRSLANSTILSLNPSAPSYAALRKMFIDLMNITLGRKTEFSKLLLKSAYQPNVQSNLQFTKEVKVGHTKIIQLLKHLNINEIPTSRLHFALKKRGNQAFTNNITVANAFCETAATSRLNRNKIEDYVLLRGGPCYMTGDIEFGDVTATNVFVRGAINKVTLEDVVLTTKTQNLRGKKTFESLTAKSIRIHDNTNQVSSKKEKMKMASKTSRLRIIFQTLLSQIEERNKKVNFTSTLNISGNLDISLLNGQNMDLLYTGTVKKNERGVIYGSKTFKSLEIVGDVKINDSPLKNLMTVNTDQNITGGMTFSKMILRKDALTDSVNGLNLGSEAVLQSSTYSKIRLKGIKVFNEDLKVSDIVLENGVRIDYVDPSAEFGKIFSVLNATGEKILWFKNSITVGDIKASNVELGSNELPYLRELGNVWLKTTEQNISRLAAGRIRVKNINVSVLNGIPVEDLVTVKGNDTINTKINFIEEISTRTLDFKKKAYLNFSSNFWNPDVKVKVKGHVRIPNATLKGNLRITGAMKNLDFMYVKGYQTVKGEMNLSTIKVKGLQLPKLKFDFLNNNDVRRCFERAVILSGNMSIFNKKFSTLKGWNMQCSGTLNNVAIDKVATTNTYQKLTSSYRFLSPTSFNKSVGVKKFFGAIELQNVTYVDMKENISNKYFKGKVITSHLNSSGNVSGVNVTLLKLAAFNKSESLKKVREKFTFRGNLEASQINVARNRSVDNVCLDNLIRLKEPVKLGDFKASSITAKNVSVTDNVNRCDLQSVYHNALWKKGYPQEITGRVHLTALEVNGSMHFEYYNGAYIPEWISFLKNVSAIEEINIINAIFNDVSTDNIYISGKVNDISLRFLFWDSVKKNVYQRITGKKSFQDINVKKVYAETLWSNKTCRTDLSKLYELSIKKSNKKYSLSQNWTLPGLRAKRVTIKGKINGLKLPEDVFLSNADEAIEEEVIIDFLNASNGLKVIGKIDGVQIEEFIQRRTTLSKPETIRSEIELEEDSFIKGDCWINKTINEIRFVDIVSGVQHRKITGTKHFTGNDLWVLSNVTVYGFINGTDLKALQKSLVLGDRNETLKDMVTFSNISTSSLLCKMINGSDIVDVYYTTHLLYHFMDDRLHNFTSDFIAHQTLISNLESVDNPMLFDKSFELHQILDFGVIERFLPVYEYGMHGPTRDLEAAHMVMWVKGKRRRATKSIVAEIKEDGYLVKTKELEGKLFPFALGEQKGRVVGFYVQEKKDTLRCSRKGCIVIATLDASGESNTTTIASPDRGTILDVRLLEVEDMIFLILSFSNTTGPSEKIFVYQYDALNGNWTRHQKFHLQDLTSLAMVDVETASLYDDPIVYLAVTGDRNRPGVTIYEWFDEFCYKTNLSTPVSTYVTWVYNDRSVYLLLAKEMDVIRKENNVPVNILSESLEVYTLEDDLLLNHTVNVKGVSFLESFGLGDETFVLATSSHLGTVYVLQFRGYNGLELVQEIPSPGVTETRVFTVGNHLYLAVNSRTRPSRILKASVRGGRQVFEATKQMRTSKFIV